MIIVKLMGGLGNQMFQYAAGCRLAHQNGSELRLDHSFLESGKYVATPRNYELQHLNVRCRRASVADCSTLVLRGYPPLRRYLASWLPVSQQIARSSRTIRERFFKFDPALLEAGDNVYLEGYWQSERYFADVAGILRGEFAVREPLHGENLQVARAIAAGCAVSLHVRRGDYVTDQQTAAFHGVCGLDYYRRAVAEILRQVAAPHFFVFSDDPRWVRENLQLSAPTSFVDHNGPDHGHEDMRLMSLCRHHIIANSSFSWWGAWLNPSTDKIVIAPQQWFNDPAVDTSDLLPPSWLRI